MPQNFKSIGIVIGIVSALSVQGFAQDVPKPGKMTPDMTEFWEPEVKTVTAPTNLAPPSDAIVLFDGNNLDKWVSVKDPSKPADWTVKDGVFTVKKGTGNIQTKDSYQDYQLHIEWKVPASITGKGQARGNSGLFLASTGKGDDGYELQILDSYNNRTYANGQAASIYKQFPPLKNVTRSPGEWNTYDVIFTAPRFKEDGTVFTPARVTVMHNGVVVQNNTELRGPTQYIGIPSYSKPHGKTPIKLQDHGDPSEPISFRNIWIREL
jgi:hypothetical protein